MKDQPILEFPSLPPINPEAEEGLSLGALHSRTRAYVEELRTRLKEAHCWGASGREVVELYTAGIDRLIVYLFEAASHNYALRHPRLRQRCSVIAQGGYGRGELNPYSDLDLLFLFPTKVTPYVETICETIYYSLLDTLAVGHAVLSVPGALRLARGDLQVQTSLLDARYLCGDETLYQELVARLEREVIAPAPMRFLKAKLGEREASYQRYGHSIYLLEPHLKDGKGGLRDVHTALWLAKARFKVPNLQGLVQKGVISQHLFREVVQAQDFLWRVRNALHFLCHSHQDWLSFAYQEQVASSLGFSGPQELMRHYYQHATTVHTFLQVLVQRCLETPKPYSLIRQPPGRYIREGVRILGNRLVVTDSGLFVKEPLNLLTVFRDAQRHGVELDGSTKQLIQDHLSLLPSVPFPKVWQTLWDILSWPKRVYTTLSEMHLLGVLGELVPEFARLRWLLQRDLYHIYTVDEHSLRGIAELERLRAGEYRQDHPLLTQVMWEVDRVAVLFLAMLFHDVGKGYGLGHEERGAALVGRIAQRWGLDEDTAGEWQALVRLHLLMSHIAQRRDLSDSALIRDFARQVGTLEVLKKLYLLTFADMKAVGPRVWNDWKGSLLEELYRRTLEVFERGLFVEEAREERVARVQERIRRMLQESGELEKVEAFLESLPENYFLVTPEESIPRHLRLLGRLVQKEPYDEVVTALEHFPEKAYSEFTVATRDRPGLFAMLAGVLAAHQLNVASARITTTHTGVALDVFRLSHIDQKSLVVAPERWERVEASLRGVLRGQRKVEDLVRASRPPAFLRRRPAALTTEVTLDNTSSREYTVIDVSTWDRLGVLFTITHCLFRLGLLIHLAKITTNVDQVLDVFYVTDAEGRKIQGERLAEVRSTLLRELGDD